MSTKPKPIPDGYHSVTPLLIAKDAVKAIEFYKQALGAQERSRLSMPDGKVAHAELQIGNSIILLGEEAVGCDHKSPQTLQGSPVTLAVYVENADQAFQKAVDAWATVKEPMRDQFWGDRAGTVIDPFGHKWTLLTHIEDVSPDEIKKRMEKMFADGGDKKKPA